MIKNNQLWQKKKKKYVVIKWRDILEVGWKRFYCDQAHAAYNHFTIMSMNLLTLN